MKSISNKIGRISLILPFITVFFLFQIMPFLEVLKMSFFDEIKEEFSFTNYLYVFNSKLDIKAISASLSLSLWSTLWGLLIAFITAFSITKLKTSKIKNALIAFTTMSNNFSGVPLAFAFIIILGTNGALTLLLKEIGFETFNIKSAAGILMIYIYFQIPLGILLLLPAINSLKPEWREANDLLGGSNFSYWRTIAIPILTKPLIGTAIILFANAIGAYATLYALSGSNFLVVPTRISSLINGNVFYDPHSASALAIILMIILFFISSIHYLFFKRVPSKGKS